MEILSGLMDHQVLQRNKKNVSETVIAGRSEGGELQVRATKGGRKLPGLNWKKVAAVPAGDFSVTLTGVPAGGPYQVALRVVGADGKAGKEVRFDDILVGDVWVLGGQSNMEGIGLLKNTPASVPFVRAFYMNDRWAPAKDPIHNLGKAVDAVHTDLNGGVPCIRSKEVGAGPGVGFGQKMFRLSGVPQGLLACAHGGTSMSQWDPDLKDRGSKSLYGATLRRVHKNGGRVAGIVWYQGCSDANDEAAAIYTERMKKLVGAFRGDMGADLPFVMVQIAGYFPGSISADTNRDWISVQDQQRRLPEVIDRLAAVPAIDLTYDDAIHISGADQTRLGDRLARAAWTLLKGKKAQKPPITVKSVKTTTNRRLGGLDIEIAFANVEGELRAPGRPTGFSIVTPEHTVLHNIYRTELAGNKVILRTGLAMDFDEAGLAVCYGYGVHAYCNITDAADRSLPVFAPLSILQNIRPRVPVKQVRISKLLPGAGKLAALACPSTEDAGLEWKSQSFQSAFLDLHLELNKQTNDAVVFFAAKFRCEEAMSLEVGLGYDGPVKAWVDGRQIFHDPNGVNPAMPDKTKVPVAACAGEHEVVVALSANFGRAWGAMIRLHRTDLTNEQIKAGPGTYKLPEVLG